jgi:hypothetical protein
VEKESSSTEKASRRQGRGGEDVDMAGPQPLPMCSGQPGSDPYMRSLWALSLVLREIAQSGGTDQKESETCEADNPSTLEANEE